MFNNNHQIKIPHILELAVKVISHVLINSETVKEVNNYTEEDKVFTSSRLCSVSTSYLMQTLSLFYLTQL